MRLKTEGSRTSAATGTSEHLSALYLAMEAVCACSFVVVEMLVCAAGHWTITRKSPP